MGKVLTPHDLAGLADLHKPLPVFVLRRDLEALVYDTPTLGKIVAAYPELASIIRGHSTIVEPETRREWEVLTVSDPVDLMRVFKRGLLTEGKFHIWEAFELEDVTLDGREGTTSRADLVDSLMTKVKETNA